MLPRVHRYRVARSNQRRSPQINASTTITTSQSNMASPTSTPAATFTTSLLSAKELVALIMIPSLLILGFVGWRIRVWMRRRVKASSAATLVSKSSIENGSSFGAGKNIDIETASVDMKEPNKVVLMLPDTQVGWVPQKKVRGVDISVPQMRGKSLPKFPGEQPPSQNIPPLIPPPVPLPENLFQPPTSSIPPPSKKFNIVPQPHTNSVPASLPSPTRSDSLVPHHLVIPPKKLPRLMMVATTFSQTMEDELSVETGDTVRLLEEFQDEWCLVQRIWRIDAPKGMVPRFCLQERQA